MSAIKTRRDYHLTRFKIDQYLEKGFDNLNEDEHAQLRQLSREMSDYEQIHFPMPKTSTTSVTNSDTKA